ncbi:MAG: hypothetical protein WAT67_12490 [Candidatus Contendobacter sp.]
MAFAAIQQKLVLPKMVADDLQTSLDALYQQCEAKKTAFDALIEQLAEQTGGNPLLTPLKAPKRALEKLVDSLGGQLARLTDILRATLVYETEADLLIAFSLVFGKVRVLRERNLYQDGLSLSDGYRDAKIDFDFDDIPVEVQFNTRAMLAAKEKAHPYYEEKRRLLAVKRSGAQLSAEQRRRLRELDRLMRTIYQEARNV